MDKQDFPTSVLTGRQRAFLRDESELTPSGERSLRQNIRERLYASIYDIQLIVHALDIEDIDKALSDPADEAHEYRVPPIASCLDSLAALLFLAVSGVGRVPDEQELFEEYLGYVATGIKTASPHRGDSVEELELTGTLSYGPRLYTLAEQELSDRSYDELTQLLVAEQIDPEEFADAVNAKAE